MIIGIDPGAFGAVCILNKDGSINSVFDIPVDVEKKQVRVKAKKGSETKTVLKVKTTVTVSSSELFKLLPDGFDGCIEKVASMPGQGVTSMFSFGETYGVIKAILDIKSDSITYIRPAEWQKHFSLTMSKSEKENKTKTEITRAHKSVIAEKVMEIYPDSRSLLTGPKGGLKDGRADAIMIARYLFEKNKDNKNG